MIAIVISAVLSLVLIGIPLLILVGLIATIMPIIGAIKANDGVDYKYPFAFRFMKED